jgi:hypothetical protein
MMRLTRTRPESLLRRFGWCATPCAHRWYTVAHRGPPAHSRCSRNARQTVATRVVSTDALALRLFHGLRMPAPASGSPLKEGARLCTQRRLCPRGPPVGALWAPASGLREGPATGTLSRASSRPYAGGLARRRSGISLGLAHGAVGDPQTRVSNTDIADRATLSPVRRELGKSTRVVDAALTVNMFVLLARRPLLTSLRLEETLAFGNLHALASARDDPHAHDAA